MTVMLRWTEEQLKAYRERTAVLNDEPVVARSKYGNIKTAVGELRFDSKAEAGRWCDLQMMLGAGLISGLERQVSFEICPSVEIFGKKIRAMRYVADFVYTDKDGQRIVEDVKGKATREYKMKRHLMRFVLGIEVHEQRK